MYFVVGKIADISLNYMGNNLIEVYRQKVNIVGDMLYELAQKAEVIDQDTIQVWQEKLERNGFWEQIPEFIFDLKVNDTFTFTRPNKDFAAGYVPEIWDLRQLDDWVAKQARQGGIPYTRLRRVTP